MYASVMEQALLPSTEFVIAGETYRVQVGDVVEKDGGLAERLRPGDNFADSSYPGCQFRVPVNGNGPIKSVAVNVRVTGRTWKWRGDRCWVRVQIEYVGDGEPSTFAGGWLLDTRVTQDPIGWYARNPVRAFA